MKKKFICLISICVVAVVLLCVTYFIYDNYRLGQALYTAVSDLSIQSKNLANSIAYLEKEFESVDSIQNVNRQSFDVAIHSVHSSFGYENMPLLENVRIAWIERFEELWQQTLGNVESLEKIFAEESHEMTELKKQLDNMTDCFISFRENYNELSFWERCFTSWKNEQRVLSDMVGLPR